MKPKMKAGMKPEPQPTRSASSPTGAGAAPAGGQTVLPAQVPRLLPLLAGMEGALRGHAAVFLDLLKSSGGGAVPRAAFHRQAFPDMDSRSATSRQTALGKAFAAAAAARGFALRLDAPKGRASATGTLSLLYEGSLPNPAPVDFAGSAETVAFIGQQHTTQPRARQLQIKTLVVSRATQDKALCDSLLAELGTRLKAHRLDEMKALELWTLDAVPGGANRGQALQEKLGASSSAGLLCVSAHACADDAIRREEWQQYRNAEGQILRPFVALRLGRFVPEQCDLGVLGQVPNVGATQLTHLFHGGEALCWAECQNDDGLRHHFVQRLLDDVAAQFFPETQQAESEGRQARTPGREHGQEHGHEHEHEHERRRERRLVDDADIQFCGTAPVPARGKPTSLNNGREQDADGVSIVPALVQWACGQAASPFAALLGEYGTGKTWTCQLLTKALHERRNAGAASASSPEPFYFDLRKLSASQASTAFSDEKTVEATPPRTPLENLLRALILHATPPGMEPISAQSVIEAVQQHGALVIFDGLDEVMVHKDGQWGVEFVRTLFSILPFTCWPPHLNPASKSAQAGKVLVSCRSHYFKSLQEMQQQLLEQGRGAHKGRAADGKADMTAWTMLPLDEAQILQYLELNAPGHDPKALLEMLKGVHNLTEICGRFIGISHVVQQIEALELARQRGEAVNAASIYQGMLEKWIERDKGKHRILAEDKPRLMQALAWKLWKEKRKSIPWNQLQDWFRHWLREDAHYADRQNGLSNAELETWLEDLRTATFIVRPDADAFAFAHTSNMEFCVAARLYAALQQEEAATVWDVPKLSPETVAFVVQLHELEEDWTARKALQGLQGLLGPGAVASAAPVPMAARRMALGCYLALARSAAEANTPPGRGLALEDGVRRLELDGMDCREMRFGPMRLAALSARQAQLLGSRWTGVVCGAVDFSQAELNDSVWECCEFGASELQGADLRASRWWKTGLGQVRGGEAALVAGSLSGAGALARAAATAPPPDRVPALAAWQVRNNLGHAAQINGLALACAPDGGVRLVTASRDGLAKIWDRKGMCVATLDGHGASLSCCAISFSPDATATVVTGDYGGNIAIWDGDGAPLASVVAHEGEVTACALACHSSGGHNAGSLRIVTRGADGTAKIWNRQGDCLASLGQHTNGVRDVGIAFTPDGTAWIVSVDGKGCARLWNEAGVCLRTLAASSVGACGIACHPAGALRLLTVGRDGAAAIWDAQGACLAKWGYGRAVGWSAASCALCCPSADTARAVIVGNDGGATIWTERGACLATLGAGADRQHACAITCAPDGRLWVASGAARQVRLWDETGACLASLRTTSGWPDGCAVCSMPDGGTRIVISDSDGQASVWDGHGTRLATLPGAGPAVGGCAISQAANGALWMLTSSDKQAKLWDERGKCHATLGGHGNWLTACALAHTGDGALRILTADDSGAATLWDGHGTRLATLRTDGGGWLRCALACAPGGATLAVTAGKDGMARIWDESGACLATLGSHRQGGVASCAIAFSPSGKARIVTAAFDGSTKLWDAQGTCLATLGGHPAGWLCCAIAFAPNGAARIATAAVDGCIRLWDEQGACLASLRAHTHWIRGCGIAYGADGVARIVTASVDGSALLSLWAEAAAPVPQLRIFPAWGGAVKLQARNGRDFVRMAPDSTLWQDLLLERLDANGAVVERRLAVEALEDWPPEALAQVKNFPDGWWQRIKVDQWGQTRLNSRINGVRLD